MNIKEVTKENNLDLNDSNKKEDLELKIKNRYSWLIIISVLIVIIGVVYVLFFNNIDISIDSLVSVLLAFFSIYLSALFYFKATEQSNQFYDRTYEYTKDINVLLSKMDGKFNKSLDIIEKGNDSIREKMEVRFDSLGTTNRSIEAIEDKKDTFLEEQLFSKLKLSDEEKISLRKELSDMENEKVMLQYQLKELLKDNEYNVKVDSNKFDNSKQRREKLVKWYQDKHGKNSFPGVIQEMIYDYGAQNILDMSDEKIRKILRRIIIDPINKSRKNADNEIKENINDIMIKTYVNMGYIDEKTKDISTGLIDHVRNEAKIYVE